MAQSSNAVRLSQSVTPTACGAVEATVGSKPMGRVEDRPAGDKENYAHLVLLMYRHCEWLRTPANFMGHRWSICQLSRLGG